jgi:hypothetical protein
MFRDLALMAAMICGLFRAQSSTALTREATAAAPRSSAQLRAWVESAPKLSFDRRKVAVRLAAGQELGNISWISRDPKSGIIWLLQRGDKADPVIAVKH